MVHDTRDHTLDITIRPDMVSQVLPEYFATDYPNLIAFIETYYDYMDSHGAFGECLKDLYDIRDIGTTKLSYLDNMFAEFALGLGQDFFIEPREILRNFARFFRVKGSLYSIKGFFRSFYNDDTIEIEYPKKDIFLIGDSASYIGPKSQKIIQDGGVHQILSILIKSETGLSEYQELYKKFVHPSGFYLSAEMLIKNTQDIAVSSITPQEYIDPDLMLDSENIIFNSHSKNLKCHSIASNIYSDNVALVNDSVLELGLGISMEWGGGDAAATLVRVNNMSLSHSKSMVDSDYYSLADQWAYGTDSVDLNTTTVQTLAINAAAATNEHSPGETYASGRQRTILEFTACKDDSNPNGFINSIGKEVHSIKNIEINDIKGKKLDPIRNALV